MKVLLFVIALHGCSPWWTGRGRVFTSKPDAGHVDQFGLRLATECAPACEGGGATVLWETDRVP